MSNTITQQARQVLSEYFGYDSFRPQQEEIIESLLAGKDTIVLMPTGGGKSICFQVPAIMSDGLAIVISPLIALMKDQVEALNANGVEAAFLNSSLDFDEEQIINKKIREGKLEMLYVSPERALSQQVSSLIEDEDISFIAIDEAHCVSSWGHDFRPEYGQLYRLRELKPNVPFIALTATADRATRIDIEQKLRLKSPAFYLSSFDRPNLSLTVAPGQDRMNQIRRFLDLRPQQAGIVYCLSKKSTEQVAARLASYGHDAAAYHAGKSTAERNKVQEDFLNDRCQIVCATIAFGMGIDKSNVRWVIHYNLPKNIESYYQEIGRSGRDGASADTLLFYSYGDVVTYRGFYDSISNPAYKETQLAKLDRMMEFAQATTCRRKILLSYFGEILEENCGNCDVCQNPPSTIDGTMIALKALSGVARTKETVAMGMLTNILRGSQNQETLESGWQALKTFGVGSDTSYFDWQQYLQQLVQQGILEIAYHEKQALKLTALAKQILFEKKPVRLTAARDRKETVAVQKPKLARHNDLLDSLDPDEALYRKLKEYRKEIAQGKGVPAYHIFSDKSLIEMSAIKPITGFDFVEISGVGKAKLVDFGNDFVRLIAEHEGKEFQEFDPQVIRPAKAPSKRKEKSKKAKSKGDTYQRTFEMLKAGKTTKQISEERGMAERTVEGHIAKLYEDQKIEDIEQWIANDEIEKVRKAKEHLNNPGKLMPYFDHLNKEISFMQIRLALAFLARE